MAILKTYDLQGNKLSFANWISNLSPTETPFTSMIGKEAVDQVMYSWQTDRLSTPTNAGVKEGAAFAGELIAPTTIHTNFTQILRKVVRVSDTANKVGLYGRDSEKAYQMEKSAKELRRDLEKAVLTQVDGTIGLKGASARKMKGFPGLVAPIGLADPDTGAVVHKVITHGADMPAFTETELFDLTYNLYLAGAKANKIMCHPKHMATFSDFMNKNEHGHVHRMFDGLDAKYNAYVSRLRDPLGQEFDLIPNKFMPDNKIFFFNEKDWTQMVLREPKTSELAKTGSSEKHMVEMEVGLRHRNPFASGILVLVPVGTDKTSLSASVSHDAIYVGGQGTPSQTKLTATFRKNDAVDTTITSGVTLTISGGQGTSGLTKSAETTAAGVYSCDLTGAKSGNYVLKISHTNGLETSVNLMVHTKDLRSGLLSDEAEEALEEAPVKARKVKAKAE